MKSHTLVVAVLAFAFICVSAGYTQQSAEQLFQSGLYKEEIAGELDNAIKIYEMIISKYPGNRSVAAKTQLHIGLCNEKLGNAKARTAYERVVREYADQSEIVAQARVRLAALGGPGASGGLVTRRVLADASGVGGVLTADGKYIRGIDWETGDMVQFEVASGQKSRITNKGSWSETDKSYENQAFSRDGKQIAYTSYTKDWDPQLRIRNLDGSGLRTLYSEKGSYVYPSDWSPDAGSILALRERNKVIELTLISTADGSVRVR
ncbi:MAG: tetratricopeptide repeat protein [Candidatus Latescibacter sp.]|nr:tetratricopeptide repeat protein [Candidatus Latescibacter sp.]